MSNVYKIYVYNIHVALLLAYVAYVSVHVGVGVGGGVMMQAVRDSLRLLVIQ